jgi:hypothetical protein
VSQARQQLEVQKSEIQQRKKEIEESKTYLSSLQTQQPQKKLMYQTSEKYKQQLKQIQAEEDLKKSAEPEIKQAEENIKQYEEQTIQPYESDIIKTESEIKAVEEDVADYERAQRVIDIIDKEPRAIFSLENERQKKYYRAILANEKAEKANIEARKQIVYTDSLGQPMSIDPSRIKDIPKDYAYKNILTGEIKSIDISKLKPSETSLYQKVYTKETKPLNVVEAYEPKGFEKARYYLSSKENVVAGVGASLLGTVEFGYNIARHPIKTVKETGKGILSIGKKVYTGEGFPEIGETLRTKPKYSTGYVIGEVIQWKAPELALKGVDYARTFKMKELPVKDIIAPEYFKGQKYPLISKGETAKELLEEFKPLLPGETKPAGFTASPRSFKKETTILKGTSELPGLYQAPKLSPAFLKITGESDKKLFSLFNYRTLKPTIARITPEEYRLIPEIKDYEKIATAQNLPKIKKFFEESAEKGKAYVPFIKKEKEAVIPFGTKLTQKDKRFFIKFGERRIPIFEYTIDNADDVSKEVKQVTAKSLLSYNERKVGKESYVTSRDLLSVDKLIKEEPGYKENKEYLKSYIKTSSNKDISYNGYKEPKSIIKSQAISKQEYYPDIDYKINYKDLEPYKSSAILSSSKIIKEIYKSGLGYKSGTQYYRKPIKGEAKKGHDYNLNDKELIKNIIKSDFEVYTKKEGKTIKVGEFTNLDISKDVLINVLKTKLRASGYIKKKGTKERVNLKDIIYGSRDFRAGINKGEKDFYRIVQKIGGKEGGMGRLSTTGELREIREARLTKISKNKPLSMAKLMGGIPN